MRRNGFTLVELLTVISIILLLILVPSLSRAKGLARCALCQDNLHQISVGFAAHNAQLLGQKLPSGYPDSSSWPSIPANVVPNSNVFRCPEEGNVASPTAGLQFYSMAGYLVPFEEGEFCMVRRGPLPPGGYHIPETPAGAIDYCFEDIRGGGSDFDYNDGVCRIWLGPPMRGEVVGISAGYTNWTFAKLLE